MTQKRHPGQRRPPKPMRIVIEPDKVIDMTCPCCGEPMQVLGANMLRLAAIAQERGGDLTLTTAAFEGADWTKPVSDEVITRAAATMTANG
jgi:hypothetical protein